MHISVAKFGGSLLRSQADLPRVVTTLLDELGRGRRVVAVVSALGRTTDHLLALAREITRSPEPATLARLLSTGENAASALVTLALQEAGLEARTLDVQSAGLVTRGPLLDAWPVAVDVTAFEAALTAHQVVVVPGFVGRDVTGEPSVLGRGGSDLTALFLAHALGAQACRLYKDVDGVYERDPGTPGPEPARFTRLSYADARRLDHPVLPVKAIRFARRQDLVFEVGRPGGPPPTRVGPGPSVRVRAGADPEASPAHGRRASRPGN